MSRDIQDFINAFGMGFSIGDRVSQRNLQAEALRVRTAGDDASNPELQDFDRKYGTSGGGATRATSGAAGIPRIRQPAGPSGGITRPGIFPGTSMRFPGSGMSFQRGGEVPEQSDMPLLERLRARALLEAQREPPEMSTPVTPAGQVSPPGMTEDEALSRDAGPSGGMSRMQTPTERMRSLSATGRMSLPSDADKVAQASTMPARDTDAPGPGSLPARPAAFDRPMTVEPPAYVPKNALDGKQLAEGTGGIPRFSATAGEGSAPSEGDRTGDEGRGQPAPSGVQSSGGPARATTGGAAGTRSAGAAGAGKSRKSLKDQTRVEAFNPDDPGDMGEADDVTKQAISGGMQYASQLFGLGNPQNPNFKQGADAFYAGTGAPDPQQMQQVDQIVQQQAPDDYAGPLGKAKLQIRRMEIMYRWAVQNGNTDRANKMAFEIMQYAAGTAAQYGQQAVAALQKGDTRAGAALVAQALDEVPDGFSVQAGPNGEMIYSDANGKVFDRKQMTPQQLFNAAMGLGNKSMYWNLLSERAGMTSAALKAGEAGVKNELRESRMQTEELRRKRLQQQIDAGPGSGRRGRPAAAPAGPSPVGEALADIRSRMPARAGVTQPGNTVPDGGEGDAPVSGFANDDSAVDDDDADGGNGGTGGNERAGPQPPIPTKGEPPTPMVGKPAPRSVLRLKDPAASQGIPVPAAKTISISDSRLNPEGAASGAPGPKAQSAPKGGAQQTPEPQRSGPGLPPRPAPAEKAQFDEPHPLAEFGGRDPYADLLAGIDPKTGKHNPAITQYWSTKQGRAEKSAILAEQRTLNKDIAAWEKREKAFQKSNAPAKGGSTSVKPSVANQTATLGKSINEALDAYTNNTEKPNTLNDGKTDLGEARDLAMELVTNNPNLTPQRALDHLSRMLITDRDKPEARSWEAHGWTSDKPDALVVVSPRGQPDIKLRMSEAAYRRMNAAAHKRWETLQKTPANEPKGTWGAVVDAARVGAQKFRPMLTIGPGLSKE